jgi:hypothetical protein
MRRITLAVLATLASIAGFSPALAAGVEVPMDEVRLVAFSKPVTTVYVGNTVIADVTLIDSRHVFLLGKTYGETNLIALSADGSVITNEHVTVLGRRTGLVTLNRGAAQFTYSCTAIHCETQPVPGDPNDYFINTHSEQAQHEGMAQGQANTAIASSAPAQ